MKFRLLFFTFLFSFFYTNAQDDWGWWNELHGWESGDPGWRNWIKITPGYMGPNALPVPEVKRGLITEKTEFQVTTSNHFHSGDPTQDISAKLFLPFAKNRIAVEMWGVLFEHFAFSEEIRNERIARNKDGTGVAIGDFYFSTLIQISKDRKFPNTLLRFATKTASGNQLESARYTDSPGYFFDLSFSKDFGQKEATLFRPFGLIGFYSWQTNDELNLQNDALLYALGGEIIKNTWVFSGSFSGYSGYKNERDRPLHMNFEMRKDFENRAVRLKYQHGLHDWKYKTLRVSFIWKFKGIN
ncbi:hypothetical protein [Maribellus maritimus]|uniref:hypothetical protein n=1 Tax=Maribellus maritimus TaxID=2870838 RepID=UPI001EECC9FA|nr:hypothetical protein [Maribellus maritimus]MCG6188548.1 hypothetical protein [Maribellus maritimus]